MPCLPKINSQSARNLYTVLVAFYFALTSCTAAFAQDFPKRDVDPERLVDEIYPVQELDVNYQELYDNLLQLLSNPVDLNSVSPEALRALYVLRENQLQSLLAYRKENGPFFSVYELQAVPELDLPTIYKLMPLVTVVDFRTTLDAAFLRRVWSEGDNYIITRYERTLEQQKGYLKDTDASSRYIGSPDNLYLRLRASRPGDFSFGFATEKDAGEAVTWRPRKYYYGMDCYSFHAQVQNKGKIKSFIAGDFLAQFGQGLVLGGGFGMGLGAETILTLRRSTVGFIPYTSVNESNFFRGIASSIAVNKNLTLHGFGSRFRKDGVLNQDSTDDNYSFISSFAATGYHRTPSELLARKQILEVNLGIVADYKAGPLEVGAIFHRTHFGTAIVRNPTPYNQFAFGGDENINVGVFINYSKDNFAFFSEGAQTLDHGAAGIAGVLGSLTRQLDVSLLYRKFARDFYSFYSNAIAENTVPQNESGMYWGWKYLISKKYSFAGFIDLFRFPWLRYRGYAPSDGNAGLLRFNAQLAKDVSIFIQAKEESKIRNIPDEGNLYHTGAGVKRNYWFNCDYSAGRVLSFKTRVQFSTYRLSGRISSGFVIFQDLNADIGRFSFSTRYALFSTDDYDNRLYVYERDAWLAFNFPAYFGTGVHSYVLMRTRITKKLDLWIRWSHTRYTDRTVIGSAGETIYGNVRNDIKLQARMSF